MKVMLLCIFLWFTVSWCLDRRAESQGAVPTKKTCFADLSSEAMHVRGKWIQKPSPTPAYGKLSCPMEWSKYACAKSTQNCYRNHTFVVTSCVSEHLQFEPVGFLKSLAGRTMAFIGDSLTRQHFISTICHLHRHAVPEMKHQVIPWITDRDWPCGAGMCGSVKRGPHSGFNTPFCLTFRHNVTICIGETLAQLPDRAQRLNNWATTALAVGTSKGHGNGNGSRAVAGTNIAMNTIKNHTGNITTSGRGVYLLSQLRELPHVLVVNEWGLHHHSTKAHQDSVGYVLRFAKENQYYPYGANRLMIYRETSPQGFPGVTGEYSAFNAAEKAALKKNNLERKGIFYAEKGSGGTSAEFMDEQKSGSGPGLGQHKQVRQSGSTLRYDGKITLTGKTCRARHFEPWTAPSPPSQSHSSSQPTPRAHSYASWSSISSLISSMPFLQSSFPLPSYETNHDSNDSAVARVPSWLLTHRQNTERDMLTTNDRSLRISNVPLLRIFDVSISLPCDGLGHIGFPDCSHYCLPGIPDLWTNLLHAFVRQSPFFRPNWHQQYEQLTGTTVKRGNKDI